MPATTLLRARMARNAARQYQRVLAIAHADSIINKALGAGDEGSNTALA